MSTHRVRLEKQLTRRQMLRQTTLAGVGVWTVTHSRGAESTTSPNEKLNLAGIGVVFAGGRGVGAFEQALLALMIFVIGHVYMAVTTGTPWYEYLKAMITGWEEGHHPAHAAATEGGQGEAIPVAPGTE